jgi:hypothetical protein
MRKEVRKLNFRNKIKFLVGGEAGFQKFEKACCIV